MKIDLADFRAWLITKPPKESFSYINNENCCLAQYLKQTGIAPNAFVSAYHWRTSRSDRVSHQIEEELRVALLAEPQTFGRVLELLDAQ